MDMTQGLFPGTWEAAAFMPAGALLAWAWMSARADPRVNADRALEAAAGAVILALIWEMNAGIKPGLGLHLLGTGALTLIFGAPVAVLSGLGALVLSNAAWAHSWSALGLSAISMVALPCLTVSTIGRATELFLPRGGFFIALFLPGFMGSGASLLVSVVAGACMMRVSGAYPSEVLMNDYVTAGVLVSFAEAWTTGAVLCVLTLWSSVKVRIMDGRIPF